MAANVVEACVRGNTVLRMPGPDAPTPISQVGVIMRTCQVILSERGGKACVLASTRARVQEYYDYTVACGDMGNLEATCVLFADAEVESWQGKEWSGLLDKVDLLLMGPDLRKETLHKGFLKLGKFSVLVFDECKHCLGRHPYSEILQKHVQDAQS